jgi:hypothetical protein
LIWRVRILNYPEPYVHCLILGEKFTVTSELFALKKWEKLWERPRPKVTGEPLQIVVNRLTDKQSKSRELGNRSE